MSKVTHLLTHVERLHLAWVAAEAAKQAEPSLSNATAAARAWWAFADEYDPRRDWQVSLRADHGATG